MFTNRTTRTRSRFIVGVMAALLFALPSSLLAQSSPLTVQPSTGKVGIGTTSPRAKLDVGSSGGSMFVLNPGSAAGPSYGGFAHHDLIMGSYLSGGYSQGFISTGYTDDPNRKFHIGSGSNGAFDGTTYFVPAFTVASGGNVGVGDPGPGQKLSINIGSTALDGVRLANSSGHWLALLSNTCNGCYSPMTQAGDFGLFFTGGGTQDTGSFVIAPWSDIAKGIRIAASGNIGIATTSPNYTLHVNGTAGKPGGGSWANASDSRLKQDVQDLNGVLDKLLRLRGVSFEYKDPESINELPGIQIGMIAQEVEQVFPHWIDEGPDGYKRLTFRGFEALTVQALRELQTQKDAQIADLRKMFNQQIAELKAEIEALQGKIRVADLHK